MCTVHCGSSLSLSPSLSVFVCLTDVCLFLSQDIVFQVYER